MFRTLVSTSLFCSLPLLAAAETSLPQRQAGLWEIRVDSGRSGGVPPMKQCVDAGTDAAMQAMGSDIGQMCSKPEIRREGDTYILDSECSFGGSRVTSHSVMKGDFSSAYSVDVHSKYNPPFMGKSESITKLSAQWLGPCAPEQQPGDVIMPNGMTMNVTDLKSKLKTLKGLAKGVR